MKSSEPDFENNDHARSEFIRQLTLQQLLVHAPKPFSPTAAIPNTLVQFWHDPHGMPADVSRCVATWQPLRTEGISYKLFDDVSARQYIARKYGQREVSAFDECRHPAMRSDYFRMCILLAEGGVYVDTDDELFSDDWRQLFEASTFKAQPLCYDVELQRMLTSADLTRADLSTQHRIFYVNNNPIATPPAHPILKLALRRATKILLGSASQPEIQETTGPGNLTIALALHASELASKGAALDFEFLLDWESIARPNWDLGYRHDFRNWRNMEQS